jgi:hypothetical protein
MESIGAWFDLVDNVSSLQARLGTYEIPYSCYYYNAEGLRKLPATDRSSSVELRRFPRVSKFVSSNCARPHGVLCQIIAKLGHGILEDSAQGLLLEGEVSQ